MASSAGPPGPDPAPSAPRIGAELQAARLRLGWEIPEIAARLRIRASFLTALEDGHIGDLPGAAYAVGFVRTYAAALGLDPDEVGRRFRAEADEVNYRTQLEFPVPVPERGVPAGAVVLVGVMLAIGAYVGWYRLSGDGALPAEVVPPVPERLAPLAQQAEPPRVLPPVVSVTVPTPPTDAPAAVPPPVLPTIPPSQAAAMAFGDLGHAGGAAERTPLPADSPSADDPRILIRAKSDSWIQVRDPKGGVVFNRVLHTGESWSVPAKPALLLTTGNAAGTELVVDGVVAAGIGGPGAVRRDVPLDADSIKSGKLPVQQAAAAVPAPAKPPAPASPQ